MKTYQGIATILYHQDPITGYEAYSLYPVDLPATLLLNDRKHWTIIFSFHFDHGELGEITELGINHAYSSNSKIFIDPERWPKDITNLPISFTLTFFEMKCEFEPPWSHHRRFSMKFVISDKN